MRFTMICIGSTGDVKPYVLLGRELQSRGHDVAICAFGEFEGLVCANGMRFFPLSGDAREFMARIMKPGTKGVTYLKEVLAAFRDIIGPFLNDLQVACADAEAIVATYFGNIIQSIAEQKQVPFIKTHYYPMDPTDTTPISSAPGLRAGKAWSRASYSLAYLLISTLELYYLTDWRREQGMPPRKLESAPRNRINGHPVPVLYAMSPLLMPRPADWDESIHMTGFWRDEDEGDYQPPEDLKAFLEASPKPVYIGFGSMTSGDMGDTLSIVLEAVRMAGVRAVLATGWGDVGTICQKDVFVVQGYVPHDWLFRHVSAVVHHGGAGTTASGVCAGCPTLVIPFGGDQPFWALRVRMLKLGPRPIRRELLTAPKLARALRNLITVPGYREAAQALGAQLAKENGVAIAASIIEREVENWPAPSADAIPQAKPPRRSGRFGASHITATRRKPHRKRKQSSTFTSRHDAP